MRTLTAISPTGQSSPDGRAYDLVGAVGELQGAIQGYGPPGAMLFVDQHGDNANDGLSWETPLATPQAAIDILTAMDTATGGSADDSVIYIRGDMHGSVVAPHGVRGVHIIGASASAGSNGATWSTATGNTPLLTLTDQGWVIDGVMFVPKAGYSAIKLDASQGCGYEVIRNCHFIGPGAYGTETGYGIEDDGGTGFCQFVDNTFEMLDTAILQSAVTSASMLRATISGNRFEGNKYDIRIAGNRCLIVDNTFFDVYSGSTHIVTVDVTHGADAGHNVVIDNTFGDIAANTLISKGFISGAGDIWRNRVTDTAADIVAVPTA